MKRYIYLSLINIVAFGAFPEVESILGTENFGSGKAELRAEEVLTNVVYAYRDNRGDENISEFSDYASDAFTGNYSLASAGSHELTAPVSLNDDEFERALRLDVIHAHAGSASDGELHAYADNSGMR